MGARTRLNSIYFSGALVAAALGGWATGSWAVFFISLAVLVGVNIHAGRIRPGRQRRRSR